MEAGAYLKNILQSFIIDSNEALDFKLVRTSKDIEDEAATFKPEMSHQIFGEKYEAYCVL